MAGEIVPQKKEGLRFSDLIKDPVKAYENDLEKTLLNQQPPKAWLKDHPFATKKVKDKDGTTRTVAAEYLPIDKTEYLLDRIFQEWEVEVLQVQPLFNAVQVTVRVKYKGLDGVWKKHDGVGAQQLQVKKDTSFADLSNLNNGAVMMAVPIAKSLAIKDACDHIGNLFGRNLNRVDANYAFQGAYSETKPKQPEDKSDERLTALLKNQKTRADLAKLKSELKTPEHRTLYDEMWAKLS